MIPAVHPSSSRFRLRGTALQRAGAALAAWRLRWRERAELARLSSAELHDAGITPYEAAREARKPFWRE